jgi:hypothetical protein
LRLPNWLRIIHSFAFSLVWKCFHGCYGPAFQFSEKLMHYRGPFYHSQDFWGMLPLNPSSRPTDICLSVALPFLRPFLFNGPLTFAGSGRSIGNK